MSAEERLRWTGVAVLLAVVSVASALSEYLVLYTLTVISAPASLAIGVQCLKNERISLAGGELAVAWISGSCAVATGLSGFLMYPEDGGEMLLASVPFAVLCLAALAAHARTHG